MKRVIVFVLKPIMRCFFVVTLALILCSPQRADACSCMRQSVQEGASTADAIFSATIDELKQAATQFGSTEVKVTVHRVWKGELDNTTTLSTAANSAACGYHFEKGKTYLIYATAHDGTWNVGSCSRTTLLDRAEEDLAILGEGSTPRSDAVPAKTKRADTTGTEPTATDSTSTHRQKNPHAAAKMQCDRCTISSHESAVGPFGITLSLLGVALLTRRTTRRRR